MDPPVFCSGRFGSAGVNGFFLAEADRIHPLPGNAFSD
jgi:hypothetical protein